MEETQQVQSVQPPPVRPRLERVRQGRAIAGVCSGIARYLGVDVAWVRIAFVVTALVGGTGLLAYLIGWLAMPEEGKTESIAVDRAGGLEGAGRWLGIGLIVLAGMIVLGNSGLIAGELLFAGVLVAGGVLLYRGDIGGPKSPRQYQDQTYSAVAEPADVTVPAAPAVPFEESPQEVETPPATYAIPPPPSAPPLPPDPAFQPRPVTPRESSPLGRFALATVLIVIGVMGVGHSAGWFEPALRQYAAAVFVVLGVALLVSSWFGRARGLILLGLLLSPLLIAVALLKVPFEGGFGDPRHTPASAAEVTDEYRLMAGQMVVDLSSVDLAEGEVVEVEASVVFGRLEIVVPADMGVEVVAKVDAGEMFIDDIRQSQLGPGPSDNVDMERIITYEGTGRLVLEAHVGFGELTINELAEVTP